MYPGEMLQSDPRRRNRRLYHPGERDFGAYDLVSQPCQFPGFGSDDRCGVGERSRETRSSASSLAIAVEDRQGILADITSAISNLKTNIRESRSTSDSQSGKGMVEITVDISDVKHLQKVIQGLKSIRGIQDVERVSQIP